MMILSAIYARSLKLLVFFLRTEVGTLKEEYLIQCTLKMFAMKCNNLNSFIMACQDGEKPEFTAKSKIKKKETLSEALVGARNKILIAFDCGQTKNSIRDNIAYDTDIANYDSGTIIDLLGVFTVSLGERDGDMMLPSQLLSDERWVGFVVFAAQP
jgi:hypothetical protein